MMMPTIQEGDAGPVGVILQLEWLKTMILAPEAELTAEVLAMMLGAVQAGIECIEEHAVYELPNDGDGLWCPGCDELEGSCTCKGGNAE